MSALKAIQAKLGNQEERETLIFYKGKPIRSDADLAIGDIVDNHQSAVLTLRHSPLMLGGMKREDDHA